MEIAFSILLLGYLVFLGTIRWGWQRIPVQVSDGTNQHPGVSLVIPARNEAGNIEALIHSINNMQYPGEYLEIVIVDDASEDDTFSKVQRLASSQSNLVCLSLTDPHGFQGSFKKRALTEGIKAAKFPIVITTDADCRFDPLWINTLVSAIQTNNWKMATGPVVYTSDGWLAALLNMELACLVAVGAVSLDRGYPNMCNGANLSFCKEAFFRIGGYGGFEQVVSGDDEFLLYKMYSKYQDQVGFVKSKQAVVTTAPPQNLKALWEQRKRWGSKWSAHQSTTTRLVAIFIFGFHLSFTAVVLMSLLGFYPWNLLLIQWLLKILFELLVVVPVLNFLGKRRSIKWFFFMQVVYSIYVLFIGLAAQFGSFNWKNRQYS